MREAIVFEVFSDDGKFGATCIVDKAMTPGGFHRYEVIHSAVGTFGAASSIPRAKSQAREAAHGHFYFRKRNSRIKRAIEGLVDALDEKGQ
jgi:hypothetical protein